VLANLLDNALRHTPAGGNVEVEVVSKVGTSVQILVSDCGEGIPADEIDHIFERFRRVDPARTVSDGGGSGLGLTIARAIAEDHGGSLTADSDGLSRGSQFTWTLPRSEPS
jgi:two-component system sensor histidine kinase BaeS